MTKKPHILITNDDGINAPGIWHLWNALKDFANVTIVAPAYEQSAVGLKITIRKPLRLEKPHWPGNPNVYSLTGTPADCVKLAISTILEEKPDLVVSGINRGTNAGRNVLYSGTVAGAIEGTLQEIPSIAFSCHDFDEPHYQMAEEHVLHLVEYFLANPPPHGTFFNINFPPKRFDQIKGCKLTRQGRQLWAESPDKREHPVGNETYYWLGARVATFIEHEESDITWIDKGYIAAVPVHIGELTDHVYLEEKRGSFNREFSSVEQMKVDN